MAGRKIRNAAEARGSLAAAARSGLARAEWARRHGVDGRSLNAWRINLERGSKPAMAPSPASPALYMPALVAVQRDPPVAAYYERLVRRGKKPMQAYVAVMRKMLHGISGMAKHGSDYDSTLLFAGGVSKTA